MKTHKKLTCKMCISNKNNRFVLISAKVTPIQSVWKLIFLCVLFIFLCSVYATQPLTVVRNWSLSGNSIDSFEMVDTCSFTVTFPDLVPPTYLFGYDRFSVTISDSMNMTGMSASPVLQISFDAGFLYFNHTLTVSIPFSSPLIFDSLRQTGQYRLYRDPFPYTGFHQWYEDDSINIDSTRSLIQFVYHHPKYVPLRKSLSHAKVKIASTGYPFDFGIFFHPSVDASHRLSKSPIADVSFNCHTTENGIMVFSNISNDNRKNIPYRVELFDICGQKIWQWNLSSFPALLQLSNHASPGVYLAVLYQERRLITTFSGILRGNGVTK